MEQQVSAMPEFEEVKAEQTQIAETEQKEEGQEQEPKISEVAEIEGTTGQPSTVQPFPSVPLSIEPVRKTEGKVDITPKGEIRFYATGRRKEATARVWLIPSGTGQITVNGRPLMDYITRISLYEEVIEPLRVTNTLGMFDVKATAKGGGLHGQAGALRHGIARALVVWNEELRPILRRYGLLTRNPRAKERKKYGRKRARRGFQFRKR